MNSSKISDFLNGISIYSLTAICVMYCATALAQTGAEVPDSAKERLDEVASSFTKDDAFMGAVLVAKGPNILLDKGYGKAVVEWNIPNTPDAKFRIGSMTKQFTAALVLLEQEEGKLSVDDPIRKYLPDAPAAWDKITIGDLLHPTSGLPNFIFDKRFFEWRMVARTPVEEMDLFKDKPLNFAPKPADPGRCSTNQLHDGICFARVSQRLSCLNGSPTSQLIQQIKDLIEGSSIQRSHLLEAISLVQSAHLKHKSDGRRG